MNETTNYFVEEIEQNKLTNKKYKKIRSLVNHIEHFLILASAVTGYISIFV